MAHIEGADGPYTQQDRADKGLTVGPDFEIRPIKESTIEPPSPAPQPGPPESNPNK